MGTQDFIAKTQIDIHAPVENVWEALIDPALIQQYMFGTKVKSDWQPGSPITWKGNWQGKEYEDRGTIIEIIPHHLLQYSHFSPLSGKEDHPDNYNVVSIEVHKSGHDTQVCIAQDNNADEKAKKHSEENWATMLNEMKKVVEKEVAVERD